MLPTEGETEEIINNTKETIVLMPPNTNTPPSGHKRLFL
jgi:hypothetical protein